MPNWFERLKDRRPVAAATVSPPLSREVEFYELVEKDPSSSAKLKGTRVNLEDVDFSVVTINCAKCGNTVGPFHVRCQSCDTPRNPPYLRKRTEVLGEVRVKSVVDVAPEVVTDVAAMRKYNAIFDGITGTKLTIASDKIVTDKYLRSNRIEIKQDSRVNTLVGVFAVTLERGVHFEKIFSKGRVVVGGACSGVGKSVIVGKDVVIGVGTMVREVFVLPGGTLTIDGEWLNRYGTRIDHLYFVGHREETDDPEVVENYFTFIDNITVAEFDKLVSDRRWM